MPGSIEARSSSGGSSRSQPSITERYPYQRPTGRKCRVFISHAGEQKNSLVDILKEGLEEQHPALKVERGVFVDELSLQAGEDAMRGIYESLRDAFVGESHSFPGSWWVV
jgi:hypothetical protein